ncbi:MAG: GvpL/GvpF family gas vesicle protein [bacterium]|nr:GvpL/GvpF family gas vesicle protein [bacterium]
MKGKGFYIYCIEENTDSGFAIKGIAGEKVFAIPCGDLEAVVSEVSLKEFGSEEIQKKAEEDLGWIKKNAEIHEKIIEEAMNPQGKKNLAKMPVIPMKFGTIFKTEERLKNILKKRHKQFKKTLKNLTGKQEWGVKVYLNRKTLEKKTREDNPLVQEKEKEIAQLPEGVAYFMEKDVEDIVKKEADRVARDYMEDAFKTLKQYADDSVKVKNLEKELSGELLPMVLNAFFLVPQEKLENFTKEINILIKEQQPNGLYFKRSGPWPPYHFAF